MLTVRTVWMYAEMHCLRTGPIIMDNFHLINIHSVIIIYCIINMKC